MTALPAASTFLNYYLHTALAGVKRIGRGKFDCAGRCLLGKQQCMSYNPGENVKHSWICNRNVAICYSYITAFIKR